MAWNGLQATAKLIQEWVSRVQGRSSLDQEGRVRFADPHSAHGSFLEEETKAGQ